MNYIEASDLLVLQNLVKRDPLGYRSEFEAQYRNYQTAYQIFSLSPKQENKQFINLVKFLAAVCEQETVN